MPAYLICLVALIVFSLIGRGVRFLLVAGLVAHRHDFKLVLSFMSVLPSAGPIWLVSANVTL